MATNKYISFNIAGNGGGGGTGGTMNIVELTKAQYEALATKDPDALYVITDADVIDLNDYALSTAVTAEISAATATKADKTSVTARTSGNFLPRWNSQGVITGEYQYFQRGIKLNGGTNQTFFGTDAAALSFYAPTSAGTAGQPLLSNGSGAPVWASVSFSFLSQSQYDALTTKNPSCIYFIISDD